MGLKENLVGSAHLRPVDGMMLQVAEGRGAPLDPLPSVDIGVGEGPCHAP
jgi:hypothetical protein